MIAEIRFKNMFSFRDEAIFSFEADRSKDMVSYHVVECIIFFCDDKVLDIDIDLCSVHQSAENV